MKSAAEIEVRILKLKDAEEEIKHAMTFALFSRKELREQAMCAAARREELKWVLAGE